MLESSERKPTSIPFTRQQFWPVVLRLSQLKNSTKNDINFLHASIGHVNESLIMENAKQQGVRLTSAMLPCVGCLEAKGRKAPTMRQEVTRAAVPFGRVHMDLCGSLKSALDGSIFMITCYVDSVSRWQWAYEMQTKSDNTKYVKCFLDDMSGMGTPGCFRTIGGSKFAGRKPAEFFYAAGICREYTTPDTSKQNGVVESAVCRTF